MAKAVHAELGPQAIYLFGSLVYRDGAQFNDRSDVDLVVVMPEIPTRRTGPTGSNPCSSTRPSSRMNWASVYAVRIAVPS